MTARQRIIPVRREYNRWVANQTLEDYALRFTAKSARHFSSGRISQTAIGAISFLALEAIGGTITLSYGTTNAFFAALVAAIVMLLAGFPIARYAIRHGVDIDLLTRGASFGYIGSTVTSLIYASFTFILFAIEASIMSGALRLAFGIPLWISYVISAIVVIPLVTYGVRMISKFQLVTQPFWIILNILPFIFIAFMDFEKFELWRAFGGVRLPSAEPGMAAPFTLAGFAAAAGVIFALMPQIGEQVDFLRFLPAEGKRRLHHRLAIFLAGPGWVVVGVPKLMAGSFLAYLAFSTGMPVTEAADPAHMYVAAFGYMLPNETAAMLLMAAFVVVSQLKINVMNAYAGSLAWSNFFSRLTHSHPGRVVWLVFNVAIALLLMQLGIYRLLEASLSVFSIIAMAWLSTISADLFINKPLGLSPPGIEFKRAHLYDINPVGLGAMFISGGIALLAHFGLFGSLAVSFAPFIALFAALIASPLLAWLTDGKYYLARKPRKGWQTKTAITCSICEHPFEPEDMAWCPAYAAPICSLCCSLDGRCHDMCKPKARLNAQVAAVARKLLPDGIVAQLATRLGRYGMAFAVSIMAIGAILGMIAYQMALAAPETASVVFDTALIVFFVFALISGVVAWFFVLAHDSRMVAEEESSRQTTLLLKEIAAHEKTDAALQAAKETAEAANRAKSRYVVGLSHELRTPLNAVSGYAQLLERDPEMPLARKPAVSSIRRSADYLSGLIDGLLDISRIESGRLEVFSNEINLTEFLDQIMDMFEPQARRAGLSFYHERDPRLPAYVRTDEKRLRQILVNLISNAIKFTDEGSVRFSAHYRNQVATFTVADTGSGIAPDDLEHIYEPFERGSQNGNGQIKPGLGLGLTITQLLVNTLGGDIDVKSRTGEGTIFTVRLMLASVDRPVRPAGLEATAGRYEGMPLSIMVVDDNEDHRLMMQEILSSLGFSVVLAESGEACLAQLATKAIDLFLLDIRMPGMNGFQLATALRDRDITSPIVMLSANIGDDAIIGRGDDSHNDTLSKPVDLNRLRDVLATQLHLEWSIHRNESRPETKAEPAQPSLPAKSDMQELLRLAEIGYLRGIRVKLDQLSKNDGLKAFCDEANGYVVSFDIEGLTRFIKSAGQDRREDGENQKHG
ncbi:hybrid sensor histidine kinase/response regulator [Martelella mediterranea]|uniref:histidine kinase n=1 Tax=Martelella mediterranea TaxID=293089 RepID=A0A4V2V4R8_9HYPH|nr:ATP-binding protein [Martelella mediterranea]TCT42100.1 signal transduction histidine kinase [Martelella mediterranea]